MTAEGMSAQLSFGFGMITAQRDPRDPRTHADLYADAIELCVLAEQLGFDAAWLSEHHFVDDGYMSSLLPFAAAVAARTSTLTVGTGILVAPLHDPVRLAEDAATVDLISRGRLVLGIGAGYRDEEFAGFGRSADRLGPVLDHVVDVLRDAWEGRPVQAAPEASPVLVTPRPHRPAGPPLWIGARTPAGIRRAARRADGLLAARVDAEEFKAVVASFTDEAERLGRSTDELQVGVHCPVFAWPGDSSEDSAWSRVEPHLYYSEWKYQDMGREPFGTRSGPPAVPSGMSDSARKALRAGAIVGRPDEVAERISRYVDAAQDVRLHFVPRLYWPGMAPALQREAMAVFAEQVVPLVRAHADAKPQQPTLPTDVAEPRSEHASCLHA